MDREQRMLDAHILQGQGYTQREIADQIGKSERTVRYYLKQIPGPRKNPVRGSKVDPYKALINEILEKNHSYNSELIYERLLRLGYSGKISVMKDYVARIRKKVYLQAVLRFETEPGLQAQVDWKEFGKQLVDGCESTLYAFVMVLGYSRKAFVRFTTRMDMATLLACHCLAFQYFGGVPHEILYDNMKTAFRYDETGVCTPTKRLSALAVHYGFAPHHCKIRRPETKGKVERTIGYLDKNFWPRMEGESLFLADLNLTVLSWLDEVTTRPLADFKESRAERFARERPCLQVLPASSFDARYDVPVTVNRESMIIYETNRYSVPSEHIGRMMTLKVHPLHAETELLGPDGSIRRFMRFAAGEHRSVIFPEDRASIRRRWEDDRERSFRVRRPKNRSSLRNLEVEIRSPAVYEAFLEGARGCGV